MRDKISLIVNVILAILLIILLVHTCEQAKELSYAKNLVLVDSTLQKEVERYRDTLGRERVVYQVSQLGYNQLLMSNNDDLAAIKSELKRQGAKLNNLQSSTIIETHTIDTMQIHIQDTLPIAMLDTVTKYISHFDFKDDWIDLKGSVNFKSAGDRWVIDGTDLMYKIENKQSISYYTKKPLFKPQQLYLTVMNTNPHTTTSNVQTYVIKQKRKWYEQWWFNQLVGCAVGATGMYFIKN